MSIRTNNQRCKACHDTLTEPSIFSDLCRTCVADKSGEAFEELDRAPDAINGDTFRLDPEMLAVAHIGKPSHLDDEEPALDFGWGPWALDFHRMNLLWLLGAEVDDLRGKLTEVTSAVGDPSLHANSDIPAAVRRVAADLKRTSLDLEESRAELVRLREAHAVSAAQWFLTRVRVRYLASITRDCLVQRHDSEKHHEPIDTCDRCYFEWNQVAGNLDS